MNDLGQRTNVEQSGAIGNRLQSGAGTSPASVTTYTANSLNQYSAIIGGGFQPPSPTYDLDGNQIDAQILPAGSPSLQSCIFSWDAENRLIAVKDASNNVLVSYHYDAQSRRISRSVGVSPTSSTLYLYDSWNCIAEYQGSAGVPPVLSKTRLWGIDLSSSIQGAGGVGGLLSEAHISDLQSLIYYPTYDGNGNVSEYLDSTGAIVAHYEYDPFGKEVVSNGTHANDFAYRFSTKPVDSVTSLLYYGYRWYDPQTGRWPSRDPRKQNFTTGEYNAYAFIRNICIGYFDVLGLILRSCDKNLPFQKDIVNKMLDNIKKNGSEENKKLIKQLEDSKHEHTICISARPAGNDATDPENESNPEKGSGTKTSVPANGEDGFTPEETLIHELSHASEKDAGNIESKVDGKRPDNNGNGFPDTEDRAVKAQNDYATAAKTGHYRTNYGDRNPAP